MEKVKRKEEFRETLVPETLAEKSGAGELEEENP
jgi:hypothetical protein